MYNRHNRNQGKGRKTVCIAIFDCFDTAVLGLSMDTNMKAELCERTLEKAVRAYPSLRGAVIHSDPDPQYTSGTYRRSIKKYGVL